MQSAQNSTRDPLMEDVTSPLIPRLPPSETERPYFKVKVGPGLREIAVACDKGDLEEVKRLAIVYDRSPHHLTHGLRTAASAGHVEVVRFLLQQGAIFDSFASFKGGQSRSKPMLEFLLENGWSPNEVSPLKVPALPMVVQDEELVRLLLDHGANPNLGPRLVRLQYTSQQQSGIITKPFLDYESGYTLNTAAEKSTLTVVRLLLESGAKLENAYPLHAAVSSTGGPQSRIPIMTYLVEELGCDVNQLDSDVSKPYSRGTPLHYATLSNRLDYATWLVEKGADPTKQNKSGESSVGLAKRERNETLTRYLSSVVEKN